MGANERTTVTIVCPGVPVSANVLKRKYRNPHAYARYRDGWKRTLWGLISGRNKDFLACEARLGHKMRLDVRMLHNRAFDDDNAVAAMKPVLDALVLLGFLANDDPEHLELHVTQQKIKADELWLVFRSIA